ncbi:MAG: hypothetical protein GY835_22555 [bacterium]|nr:hypothetical protein [bacterium]
MIRPREDFKRHTGIPVRQSFQQLKRWVTLENGNHVQIDGDGKIVKGFGKGKHIKDIGKEYSVGKKKQKPKIVRQDPKRRDVRGIGEAIKEGHQIAKHEIEGGEVSVRRDEGAGAAIAKALETIRDEGALPAAKEMAGNVLEKVSGFATKKAQSLIDSGYPKAVAWGIAAGSAVMGATPVSATTAGVGAGVLPALFALPGWGAVEGATAPTLMNGIAKGAGKARDGVKAIMAARRENKREKEIRREREQQRRGASARPISPMLHLVEENHTADADALTAAVKGMSEKASIEFIGAVTEAMAQGADGMEDAITIAKEVTNAG